jgi:hypothetical protein
MMPVFNSSNLKMEATHAFRTLHKIVTILESSLRCGRQRIEILLLSAKRDFLFAGTEQSG